MATRDLSRAVTIGVAAAALLAGGMLIGRTSTSAGDRPSVLLMPVPAECVAAWQGEMKLGIESGTGAKVSFSRFGESVAQYPNLAGFVRIDGVDKVAPADLRMWINTAMARCYAGGSATIDLSNPQFGRLLQLALADFRNRTKLPLYLTLDGEQVVIHYNLPQPK